VLRRSDFSQLAVKRGVETPNDRKFMDIALLEHNVNLDAISRDNESGSWLFDYLGTT